MYEIRFGPMGTNRAFMCELVLAQKRAICCMGLTFICYKAFIN
jgi:hypothetical protein